MAAHKPTLIGGRPVLLAAVLCTGVAVGVLAKPLWTQDAAAALTRAPAPVSQPAARTVPSLIQAVAAPVTRQAQRYEIDERTLTDGANAWLRGRTLGATPLGSATLDNLRVQLGDGQMTVSGTVASGTSHMAVQASASPEVESGRVLIHVSNLQIGAFVAPEPVRQSIEQFLKAQLDQTVRTTQVAVQSVEITQGKLVILAAAA